MRYIWVPLPALASAPVAVAVALLLPHARADALCSASRVLLCCWWFLAVLRVLASILFVAKKWEVVAHIGTRKTIKVTELIHTKH